MERRQYLASLSAAASLAVAGCMGGSDDPSTTEPTTNTTDSDDTTDTTTSGSDSGPLSLGDEASLSGDRALTVESASAHASVLARADGGVDVVAPDDGRYVIFTMEGDALEDYQAFVSENVTVTIGDTDYGDPVFPLGGGRNRFQAAFPVPADLTPYTGSITVDTGDASATWELDARGIEAITQTVDYEVTDVQTPDAVEAGSDFDVTFTVNNAAADPLRFLAILSASSSTRLNIEVPGSTEKEYTRTVSAPSDADTVDVQLDWGDDGVIQSVDVEAETTTTTSN